MCDVNDPRILNAYIAITEDEPTDWLLLGYKDSRNVISLYASGVNGLSEFREHITNEILFGYVRVDNRFILITYVPDSVSGVRRARALVHSRAVAGILELSHAQITASSLSDISDANIRTRLKLGQNQVPNRPRSSLINTPTKRTSVVARRRKSGQYPISPSPSPSPMSERNLKILTTDEPLSYDEHDRSSMTATPTPSTPTSVASSFAESSISTVMDNTFDLDAKRDAATEAMLQLQLAKKKELEEARFRQFQKDQQEERFKRDQAMKRYEQEEKEKQQQQQQQLREERPLSPLFLNKKELQHVNKRSSLQRFEEQQQQEKSTSFPFDRKQLLTKRSSTFHQFEDQQQKEKSSSVLFDRKELLTKRSFSFQQKIDEQQQSVVPPVVLRKVVSPIKDSNINNKRKSSVAPVVELKKVAPEALNYNYSNKPAVVESTTNKIEIKPEEKTPTVPAAVVASAPAPSAVEVVVKEEPVVKNTIKSEAVIIPEIKTIKKEVLMTGFASVQTNSSPFWKRRYFVIETDSVSFYKDEMNKAPISTIQLSHVTRVAPANEDEDTYVPNSFIMDTQTGDAYQVFADEKKIAKKMYSTIQFLC